ncbi:MAG: hypothetical protein IKE41_03080, partial [Clostridia bacterium]|nr:hypothetical protein [Clostridia bacterium]
MEQIKSPVEAFDMAELDEASLEHVSGGIEIDVLNAFNLFARGQQQGAVLANSFVLPFKGAINENAFKRTYGAIMKDLATYNNSGASAAVKIATFVENWNKNPNNQKIDAELAHDILAIGTVDIYEQAIIV